MQNHRQSEFFANLMYHESDPGYAGYPTLNVYMAKFDPGWEGYPVWQTGLPALTGHPTYHVNVIKLKREIVWTGGLPHLVGLPHLPGVPHLHVNRPYVHEILLHENKNHFHINGFALSLALKQRLQTTRKWPFQKLECLHLHKLPGWKSCV